MKTGGIPFSGSILMEMGVDEQSGVHPFSDSPSVCACVRFLEVPWVGYLRGLSWPHLVSQPGVLAVHSCIEIGELVMVASEEGFMLFLELV